jgi:hypothetical protein
MTENEKNGQQTSTEGWAGGLAAKGDLSYR